MEKTTPLSNPFVATIGVPTKYAPEFPNKVASSGGKIIYKYLFSLFLGRGKTPEKCLKFPHPTPVPPVEDLRMISHKLFLVGKKKPEKLFKLFQKGYFHRGKLRLNYKFWKK